MDTKKPHWSCKWLCGFLLWVNSLDNHFFATEVSTGRYDASTGLVLRGDGYGNLLPEPMENTGFYVDGDAKGLAKLLTHDGRILTIATINSERPRIFLNNKSGNHYRIGPNDMHATIALKNGKTYKEEFRHGSTYLSQSSRYLSIPRNAESITITNYRGESRLLDQITTIQWEWSEAV